MGNFKGHALPGSFFLIVGLWWSVKFSLWHASRRNKNACHLASKITSRRLEVIEASVILLFALVGMMAEQFVPDGPQLKLYNYEDKHWDHLMNWQHATMYLFFGISAAVSITVHTTGVVPIAFDRLLLAIAVFVEVSDATSLGWGTRVKGFIACFAIGVLCSILWKNKGLAVLFCIMQFFAFACQYPCLWTVSTCTVNASSPAGGATSYSQNQVLRGSAAMETPGEHAHWTTLSSHAF
ncbi:UNVERIFIED_CONTAM: hypothetical protein FKN15_036228 [Acipenser sinensis]